MIVQIQISLVSELYNTNNVTGARAAASLITWAFLRPGSGTPGVTQAAADDRAAVAETIFGVMMR